jgi:soluble lytic murein transglycosylase-like protein
MTCRIVKIVLLPVAILVAATATAKPVGTSRVPEVTEAEWDYYRALEAHMEAEKVPEPTEVYLALRRLGVDSTEAARLAPLFERYASEIGTDPRLLVAIAAVESEFRERVVSHAGAVGIMQVVPSRRAWGKYEDNCGARITRQNLMDAEVNICFGAYIYAWFKQHHRGNRRTALHAYNNGSGQPNGYADRVLRVYNRLTTM